MTGCIGQKILADHNKKIIFVQAQVKKIDLHKIFLCFCLHV